MAKAKNLKISLLFVFFLANALSNAAHAQQATPDSVTNNTQVNESSEQQESTEGSPEAETPNVNASVPRFSPSKEQLIRAEQALLASHAPQNTTAVWIEYEQVSRLAFWKPSTAATPLGAVLAVVDQGEHLLTSIDISNAFENLPNHGWATLTIYLSDLQQKPVPARPKTEVLPAPQENPDAKPEDSEPAKNDKDNDEASNTSEAVDETQVVFQDDTVETQTTGEQSVSSSESSVPAIDPGVLAEGLINQAIAHLHSLGQYNIVLLGEGLGGTRALQYTAGIGLAPPPDVKTQQPAKAKAVIDRPIRALILFNVLHLDQQHSGSQEQTIESLLTTPQIPTLDLYVDHSRITKAGAELRKRAARTQRYENYIQRRWPTPPRVSDSQGENKVTRAIRHFLELHAKGVKLE